MTDLMRIFSEEDSCGSLLLEEVKWLLQLILLLFSDKHIDDKHSVPLLDYQRLIYYCNFLIRNLIEDL